MGKIAKGVKKTHFTMLSGNYCYIFIDNSFKNSLLVAHVGKYDRADDRPKLAMLAIDIGLMIDRGLDDNWLVILAPKSLPMIGRE